MLLADISNSVKRLLMESEESKKKEVQPVLTESSTHKEKEKENTSSESSEMGNVAVFKCEGAERLKFKRFEMTIFCGEKPDAWVYKAETYFDMHQLSKFEKMKVSICSLDPDTVDWFRYAHNRKAILSWSELKARIFNRFRPSQEGNLM